MDDKTNYSYFDNTRLSDFKSCPRRYYFRHVRHIRRDGTSLALIFGLSWHDAMDVIWGLASSDISNEELVKRGMAAFLKTWMDEGQPYPLDLAYQEQIAPRHPGVAAEMLYHYVLERRNFIKSCEVLAIEQPFAVPIDENRPVFYIGRLDKVFRKDGRVIVGEHKTTSAYAKVGGFRTDYLESWSPNSQVDGYTHAAHLNYENVGGVWVDAALVHKQVHDKFKFIPIDRQFNMIEVFLDEVNYWIDRVEEETRRYKEQKEKGTLLTAFPKNTSSCNDYGGCPFRGICKFVANPEEHESFDGYIEDKWEPFNVLQLEKIGMPEEGKS